MEPPLIWQAPGPVPEHRQIETLIHHLQAQRRIEVVPTEQLVYRLMNRGERIEAVAAPRARLSQPAPHRSAQNRPAWTVIPPVKPVPRVVRRPAVVTIADGQPLTPATNVAVSGQRPVVTSGTGQAGRGQPAMNLGPMDINHLTDHVIQAIDQRIIAQRERMGRI